MLLDTDILIDLERGFPAADAWLATLIARPFVCGMSALELVIGCRDTAELRRVQTFLRAFVLIWPTEADMNRALLDYAPLHLTHGLGGMDALIAACAVGRGLPLATFNVRHFRAVPDLETIQPYDRRPPAPTAEPPAEEAEEPTDDAPEP